MQRCKLPRRKFLTISFRFNSIDLSDFVKVTSFYEISKDEQKQKEEEEKVRKMAEAFVVNIATEATEGLFRQIWQNLQCLLNYGSNIEKLRDKVKDLESEENTVQLQVDVAERDAQVIAPNVLNWMDKVETIKKEVDEILKNTGNAQWGCVYFKCPKLHSRYKLSKKALEWTTEVIELQNANKFEKIGYPATPGQMSFTSPGEFYGFESRMRNWNSLMESLKDNSINTIGICGMAGVGKTTLVNEIAQKVKATNLFDEVVMAVVSKDPVVANIQNELAESLGLKLKEITDRRRAERLNTRLKNKNSSILVILDDLWDELDLQRIGIPVDGKSERLKVLLTSRFKEVCSNMRATTFEVEVLSREESWHLFKEAAEISGVANDVKDIAEEVAKECGGLPLAIVIVGKALRNKEKHVWRDALHQLKQASVTSIRGMQELVYSRIRLSYDYLGSDDKQLLLLCSLFPEDFIIPLETLVRYSKGLQLFKNVETMSQVRDRVCTITDQLKSCYLLLEGNKEKLVKLHDVVRDVCLSLASSGEHMHLVKHGGLMEWPQEDNNASLTAISLTFAEVDELRSCLDFPELKLLRLTFQENKLHVREDFFERMKDIKVLELFNLSGELPSSLQLLENLRTLCLDCCRLHGDLSVIGSQKKLEILSFYGSYLNHFPHKIAQLINLKSLDLRFKEGPPLPPGILVSLENLEELYLGSYFQEWESKGEEAYSVIITEISSLQKLQSIRLCAYDDHCLEKVLEKMHLEKLINFQFTCTTDSEGVGDFQFGKVLNLERINVDFLKNHVVQRLLSKTEDLTLTVKGLTSFVNEVDGNEFVSLKKLSLQYCDLKCLVDSSSSRTIGGAAFINLEELIIKHAKNLEELCHGNLPLESFARLREVRLCDLPKSQHLWSGIEYPCLGNLRLLDIKQCGSLRSLFLNSSSKCLLRLQYLKIVHCPKLETIFLNEAENELVDVELPMLKVLHLKELKSFRSFSLGRGSLFGKVMLPKLETLIINKLNDIRCVVDDLMPIGSLSNIQTIKMIRCDDVLHVAASPDTIKMLQSLKDIRLIWNKSVEAVFDFTCLNIEGGGESSLQRPLAALQSLSIIYLPKLTHIWRMPPEGINAFTNLRELMVWQCNILRYLLSPPMAKMLVSLETLNLFGNDKMEAIIGVDERVISEIETEDDIVQNKKEDREQSTNNSRRLQVQWLSKLGMFCSENVDLEEREITEIESEEDIVKKKKVGEENTNKILLPKLRRLVLKVNRELRMWCSEDVDLELPSLTELEFERSPKMTKFCVGRLSATMLTNVKLINSADNKVVKVALDEFSSWLKDCESRIRCLSCSCDKEEECIHLDTQSPLPEALGESRREVEEITS